MPFYRDLDPKTSTGKRVLCRLLALREEFEAQGIPERNLQSSLLLASWNIREFDSTSHGFRTAESMQYIAEIVSRFDLVAIQEVRRSLDALHRLMSVLGPYWSYLVSDVTEGPQGNRERLAFVFDTRKVRLSGLAGEIVLPDRNGKPVDQIDRTPYLVGFKAGWAKFALVTVHMRWGSDKANDPQRLAEIEHLAKFLDKRATDKTSWTRNMIVLGDFNIFDHNDDTMLALTDNGFSVPEPLIGAKANLRRNRAYDQIAFHVDKDRISDTGRGGVFDFQPVLYRPEDEATYRKDMGPAYETSSKGEARDAKARTRYYRQWATHQMSDHLPLWTELKIDYSERYLRRKLEV